MADWGDLTNKLDWFLRLKTFVVGLKLVEDEKDLAGEFVRRLEYKATLCQLITICRTHDWTVAATADDLVPPSCGTIVGLSEMPDYVVDGRMRSKIWLKDQAEAARAEQLIPRAPTGKYKGLILAPLRYNPFDPDLVILYPNPGQASILINAIQFDRYERLTFHSVGETSCADVIAEALLSGKPALSIPCFGERRFGHAADEELALALPPGEMARVIDNLAELYRRGVRYPIAQYGATADVTDVLGAIYNFD